MSEELLMVERIGIGATAFILVYFLLKRTMDRAFAQADKILDMAETTIKENTIALGKMNDCLINHTKQKDLFIEEMKDCRKDRNEQIKELKNLRVGS